MIELRNDSLVFSFPQVHKAATLTIHLQRTLRIPDDDKSYPLPPGLGRFPLCHVDDFAKRVPEKWIEHGGVMFPMYQSEAMWICFDSNYDDERETSYPFAVKIATGKVSAISGEEWKNGVNRDPQDYVVIPEQPWLDGYCVEKGIIRQFVAMPLGAGYTAEEQVTGKAEHGGLQILAYPMKREVYEKRFPKIERRREYAVREEVSFCMSPAASYGAMGLAPGGRMRQEIYDDPYDVTDWDLTQSSRCFVHIANSMVWHSITGKNPPTTPPTAEEYTAAGLPWFEWYDDNHKAIDGAGTLADMKSVAQLGEEKGDVPLPENQSVTPDNFVKLRAGLKPGQVREWRDPVPSKRHPHRPHRHRENLLGLRPGPEGLSRRLLQASVERLERIALDSRPTTIHVAAEVQARHASGDIIEAPPNGGDISIVKNGGTQTVIQDSSVGRLTVSPTQLLGALSESVASDPSPPTLKESAAEIVRSIELELQKQLGKSSKERDAGTLTRLWDAFAAILPAAAAQLPWWSERIAVLLGR